MNSQVTPIRGKTISGFYSEAGDFTGTVLRVPILFPSRVVLDIEGNPSTIVEEGHRIASEYLGHAPWHFTILNLRSPMERGLGEKSDSKWLGHLVAELKDIDADGYPLGRMSLPGLVEVGA